MSFDEWYQEQIRAGAIKQPCRDLYKALHRYWLQVEASGTAPTTSTVMAALALDFSERIKKAYSLLADAFESASISVSRLVEELKRTSFRIE